MTTRAEPDLRPTEEQVRDLRTKSDFLARVLLPQLIVLGGILLASVTNTDNTSGAMLTLKVLVVACLVPASLWFTESFLPYCEPKIELRPGETEFDGSFQDRIQAARRLRITRIILAYLFGPLLFALFLWITLSLGIYGNDAYGPVNEGTVTLANCVVWALLSRAQPVARAVKSGKSQVASCHSDCCSSSICFRCG